jgi:D-glycero-alpha-D-manno-heptose-7-phosphate kinase
MFRYPHACVSPIRVPDSVWWELERRLVLVFLGKTHSSSALHQKVIAEFEREGGTSPRLEGLRRTAEKSRDALYAGDFAALGAVMAENTELQAGLHPDLVGLDARAAIEIAQEYGAVGWKVNGAGGEGGSVTLLCGESSGGRRRLIRAITEANPLHQPIPIYLSRFGLRVWEA